MRWVLPLLVLPACAASVTSSPTPAFSAQRMLGHIRVLSSNQFEGRAPGTPGEDLTVAYLIQQFKEYVLEPGNPDGTYLQTVPLVGSTSSVQARFSIGGRDFAPQWVNDFVAFSSHTVPHVSLRSSELVFCGYGVVAPEFRQWDDFKHADVRGKTIVVLVNDPQVPDPRDPAQLDPTMFQGKAMTYYGRWTYKYEEAARKGAAGCLIIHETGPAGYPFAVVAASQGRENFFVRSADGNAGNIPVAGWLTLDLALRLFAAAHLDFAHLKAEASTPGFRPVSLGGTASFEIDNAIREVPSRNVVAKLTGSNPTHRNEYVVYTAHWDHLGRDPRLKGDPVYHGAVDNASGTACLLELAHAFAGLPAGQRPDRSLLFLAVTAEEKGLLGSHYYVTHPLYPLRDTVADLNLDIMNVHGRLGEVQSFHYPTSDLDDLAREVAQSQGRAIHPEFNPENGMYYRSDHFEFAKAGVPACMVRGRAADEDYYLERYHKVTDVIQPDWTMEGAVQDVDTLFQMGRHLADSFDWPQWRQGSPFKALREAQRAP